MPNSVERSGNIDTLTGLRAFLIFWIVLYHLQEEVAALLPWLPLQSFAAAGFAGVDFFFILSGFVIAYSYAARFRSFTLPLYGRFLWLRLARVYPLHLLTLAATVLLFVAAKSTGSNVTNPDYYSAVGLVKNLFLVQAWDLPMAFSWNAIAWAVSCEWLAYLLFPIVIALTLRVRGARASTVGVFAILWLMAAICQGLDSSWQTAAGAGNYGVLRVVDEFVAGCLLYNLYSAGVCQRWGRLATVASLLTVIGLSVAVAPSVLSTDLAPVLGASSQVKALWLTPLCAIAIYFLAWEQGAVAKWFRMPVMMAGGHLSYALYMTHFLCLIVLRRVWPLDGFATSGVAVRVAVLLVYFAVMVGVAIAANYCVEEPARHWMKRWVAPRRTTAS